MLALGQFIDVGVVDDDAALVGQTDIGHVLFEVCSGAILNNDFLGLQRMGSATFARSNVLAAIKNHTF